MAFFFKKKKGKEKLEEAAPTEQNAAVALPSAAADSRWLRVIIRPLVTEKAAAEQGAGKYAFLVARGANKIGIKQAVKNLYGVDATAVNIINAQGKRMRSGQVAGKRSDFKKAIVTLKKGQTITVHEGV